MASDTHAILVTPCKDKEMVWGEDMGGWGDGGTGKEYGKGQSISETVHPCVQQAVTATRAAAVPLDSMFTAH